MAPCPCCDAPLRLNRGKNAPADPNHTWGRRILASLPEFQSQKSVVEQAILDRGHIVIYSPIWQSRVRGNVFAHEVVRLLWQHHGPRTGRGRSRGNVWPGVAWRGVAVAWQWRGAA